MTDHEGYERSKAWEHGNGGLGGGSDGYSVHATPVLADLGDPENE